MIIGWGWGLNGGLNNHLITSQHEAHLGAYTIMGYRGWGRVKQSSDHATAQHIWGATQSVIIHADKSQSICWLKHAMKCQSISRLLILWHGVLCQTVIWSQETWTYVCIPCFIGWESWESRHWAQRSRVNPQRSKNTLVEDPWGFMSINPCVLCHWTCWNSRRFYSILALF